MERIHDRATKFFTDVRKKKVAPGNKVDLSDSQKEQFKNMFLPKTALPNHCCYCEKAFISSKFLLKHILRRHAEDFIALHRKCLKLETNNNSSDSKYLLDVIREEFSKFREELLMKHMKDVAHDDHFNSLNENETHAISKNCELQPNVNNICVDRECNASRAVKHTIQIPMNSKGAVSDHVQEKHGSGSNEFDVIKGNVLEIESNVKCLFNKFEGLEKVVKTEILSKQDINTLIVANEKRILKEQEAQFLELRCNLQVDLNMLSNKLHENNAEWMSQFSELRKEIDRLDHVVELIRKQMNYPDCVEAIEKKIIYFLGSNSRSAKNKIRKKTCKLRNKSSVAGHSISTRNFDNNGDGNVQESLFYDDDKGNKTACSASYAITQVLNEKMSSLGIDPHTSKISCKEYEEKIKHINIIKTQLHRRNQNFLQIYDEINIYADERVVSKLKNKERKIRFSEPLIFNRNTRKYSQKSFQNNSYPVLDNKNPDKSEPHIDSRHPAISELHIDHFSPRISETHMENRSSEISELHSGYRNPVVSESHTDSRNSRNSEPHILNEDVYPKSSHPQFQNVTYMQNKNICDIGGGGDCLEQFQEIQRGSSKQLQSTPLKASMPADGSFVSDTVKAKDSNYGSFTNASKALSMDKTDFCNKERDFHLQFKENANHPPEHFLKKIHVLDEDISSLESCSSWEDDEN